MLSYLSILAVLFSWYSYGAIDLNLTISSHPLFLAITDITKSIYYFNRPLSLKVYLLFIFAFFIFYAFLLVRKPLTKFPWKPLIFIAAIFTFSYPLLSHDSFKYLFAAKMVVKYGLNPHTTSPDFVTGDLWLRFLRWTHTPSPYGPVFTLYTIPAYILGLGKFTLSLYLLKLFNLLSYLYAVVLIGKLSKLLKFEKKEIVANQIFFALNPLILIENLTNVHNDMPMITLLLLAIYLYFNNKQKASLLSLLLSAGIKYITIIFLPVYVIGKKINKKIIINLLAVLLLIAPILYYRQYQPWYITWYVALASLSKTKLIRNLSFPYSFSGMLKYIPFISTGLWSASQLQFALLSFTLPIAYLFYHLIKHRRLV